MDKEPFYFKSSDKVIGIAHNVEELKKEITKLLYIDPKLIEYHLREGNIVKWLEYIGENELAKKLRKVTDPVKAYEIIDRYINKKESSMDIKVKY